MKKIYNTLGIAVLFFICSYSLTYAAPVIVLEILDSEIMVGEIFGINVTLEGLDSNDELLAFGFDVENPFELKFIDANVGPDFMDDSYRFPNTDVAGSAFPALPGGRDIILATLNLSASSAGTYLLYLNSYIEDPNEGLFTLLDPQQIELSAVIEFAAVPVPGTLLLLSFGLLLVRLQFRYFLGRNR